MAWRIALLVVAVTVIALAGAALYLHQLDRYPLRAVPTLNRRAYAADACTERINQFTAQPQWESPEFVFYPTKSECIDAVLGTPGDVPRESAMASTVRSLNAHNRRRREIEWLVFAAVSAVVLFASAALLFWRPKPRPSN
jgi:hypothetical protein